MTALTQTETEAILTLCLMASFSDGEKSDAEREQIGKIATSFAGSEIDLPALYQRVLMQSPHLQEVAGALTSSGAKKLAYEMAVCVVAADNLKADSEKLFLADLRAALQLDASSASALNAEASTLALMPVPGDPPKTDDEASQMILNYAIAAGALELLPQTLATLAIVPLQTKMVYRIGKQYGVELDKRSVGEFMATVGLGLASQVFEGFARRLARSLGKQVAGKLGGKIGDAVGGITMSFGSTYALGHLARLYYGSGRSLSIATLKSKYTPLLDEGKVLAQKYTTQITEQSQKFQSADIGTLLKSVV